MARVWIEDRAKHADFLAAVEKAKAARREPPGRWRVRWYDPDNKPKAKTFPRKPPAEAFRDELLQRLANGSYRDPAAGKTTLEKVAEEWFAAQAHLKRSSRSRYRRALDAYVLPKWGTTPVDRIRHEDVAEWIGHLTTAAGLGGKPLGPAVVRGLHRVLFMTLEWAVRTGRVASNPAARVPLPRRGLPDHVYLTHDQVDRLADAAGRFRPLVLLLAYTGLRFGEVSALRVGRVDLAARRAHVVTAFAEDNGEVYEDTPKDHERRSVPLPAFLVAELKPVVDGRAEGELLFPAPRKGPLRAHNFRSREFAAAVKAAGLGHLGVTPHKLRHTAASLAIAAGADVKVVQTMLGHASATMTLDVYGHLFPDRLDEVADALDAQRTAERSRNADRGEDEPA
ncbi:tyrosine-type recombinase/integrase [Streptomyces alkaliphilus]|uniref:Tyrosine-type recombinase/integrase n=1 Tax=Streptomyces alkaliphilus TaxID=1472722 RepID=A0A7W3TBP7_9ACTN|nr:site-specific integrase [Streptomyces alkaliphilus]MBB0243889.1 tyrosine-type recombinase/integrase [Streptomyces alkaliphilus]